MLKPDHRYIAKQEYIKVGLMILFPRDIQLPSYMDIVKQHI